MTDRPDQEETATTPGGADENSNAGRPRTEMPVEFRVFNEIGIISQLSNTLMTRRLPHGLTNSQFGLLNHFSRRDGEESPVQLAHAFQVSKAAMTNTLGKLAGKGFLAIRPHPVDGRGKLVSITEAGRAAHRAAIAAIGSDLTEVRKAVGHDELEAILPVLQKLRIYLDDSRDN